MTKACSILLCLVSGLFQNQANALSLLLESPAFEYNAMMPIKYTCHDSNVSPPLSWKDSPSATQSYVLMMYDPDAPDGTWVHWIWFNIPAARNQLAEGASLPPAALSGQNSWQKEGYTGPCPPQGMHRYIFQLIALDTQLTLKAGVTREQILRAIQGHELAESSLIGLFGT